MRRNNDLTFIVIHHGASPGTYGSYEAYRNYHLSLGFEEIAYDFLIDDGGAKEADKPEGTLVVCPRWWNQRELALFVPAENLKREDLWRNLLSPQEHMDAAGAYQKTNTGVSANKCGIHVVLCGDYDKKAPSKKMMATLILLVERLQERFGIPFSQIIRHSDLAPKSCPGAAFPWAEFKEAVSKEALKRPQLPELDIPKESWKDRACRVLRSIIS